MELDLELLKRIMNKYGEDEQMRQAMGECGEFIAAAQNYYRAKKYGHREETIADLMEEAVDVYFMMQQMRYIDPVLFDRLCEVKREKILAKIMHENR